MNRERVKHPDPITPGMDITKPLPVDALIAATDEGDCYSYEWKADHPLCCICSAKLMCGILYNARQKKQVKVLEETKGYLDLSDFDGIVPDDMIIWLAYKPRTGKQFIDKVQKFTNCSDRQTCVDWCKSFILEHQDVLAVGKDKIIIVNQ